MKLKGQVAMCQVSTCKRAGKYLLKWEGDWLLLCASHERHFGHRNLQKLGLPPSEIAEIMAMGPEEGEQ